MTAYTLDNRGVRAPTSRGAVGPAGPTGPTGGTPFLNTGQIIIPTAGLLTAHSAPTILVPAPGPGLAIAILWAAWEMFPGTTQFAAGGNVGLYWGAPSGAAVQADTGQVATFVTASNVGGNRTAFSNYEVAQHPSTTSINLALVFGAVNADFTLGNGSLAVNVVYQIIPIT